MAKANTPVRKPYSGWIGRWLKIIGVVCAILLVLVFIGYFIATSSGFFKGFILPKVSKAVGADVTVSDAEVHPFSSVVLHDVQVQVKGQDPILKAKEIHANYSLWSIIHGNIVVSEVAIVSPTITVVTHPDGSSNIPKPPPSAEKPKTAKEPAKTSAPPKISIGKIAITGATIRQTQEFDKGKSNFSEVDDLNFSIENLKNGQTAKMALQFDATLANNPPDVTQAASLLANATGNFSFALTDDLKPGAVVGDLQFAVSKASGAMSDLSALAVTLHSEMTPTEIKQFALQFKRGTTPLGEISASGPFDISKNEGRVTVTVRSIDRQVLNIVGVKNGIDFGTTTINSSNQIDISQAGKLVTVIGTFDLNKLQIKRAAQVTPTLDLDAGYQLTVDLNKSSANLSSFKLEGAQNNVSFLRGDLTAPLSFSWGGTGTTVGNSSLTLAVNNFNLADWRALAGDMVSAGILHANLKLSQAAADKLSIDLSAGIDSLTATVASNRISQAGVDITAHVDATELKQFQIASYQLSLSQAKQPVATVSGNGSFDSVTRAMELQANIDATLSRLLAVVPQPTISAQSGTVKVGAHISQKQNTQKITGDLVLADFTGKVGANEFNSYASDVNFEVGMDVNAVHIQKLNGAFRQAGNDGGTFSVSGEYDRAARSVNLNIGLANLNENAVRPFLESMLAGKKLVSVNINATVTAQYDPKGATAFKADAQVTKLVVNDPKADKPGSPLEAKLLVDASLQNQVANLRQFQITLTPTDRAKNAVTMEGQVDMSITNVIHGNVALTAESLDLTSYYDIFSGQPSATPATGAAPAPAQTIASSSSSEPNAEPAAVNTPFRNFTVAATIGKLYLRELEIDNFKTTLKLDGGHIVLNPFSMSMNGRPVTANIDANLGIPGYVYNVAFNADTVPLTPLVDTFQPDRKGQIGGTVTAVAQIKGAGVTGANLKKNLNGKFDVTTTNMNLLVVNLRSPVMVRLLNFIGVIPDLLKNPSTLLTTLGGTGNADTGLAGKLNNSPINIIVIHGTAGNGEIELKQATVEGTLFKADAVGTVKIDDILTNSPINFPVIISLERNLASSVGLSALSTTPNTPFIELPPFVTMIGTVGNPQMKKDTTALAKIALTAGIGVGSSAVNLVNQLSGKGTTTNAPDSVIQQGSQLLNGILGGGKKKKK